MSELYFASVQIVLKKCCAICMGV